MSFARSAASILPVGYTQANTGVSDSGIRLSLFWKDCYPLTVSVRQDTRWIELSTEAGELFLYYSSCRVTAKWQIHYFNYFRGTEKYLTDLCFIFNRVSFTCAVDWALKPVVCPPFFFPLKKRKKKAWSLWVLIRHHCWKPHAKSIRLDACKAQKKTKQKQKTKKQHSLRNKLGEKYPYVQICANENTWEFYCRLWLYLWM